MLLIHLLTFDPGWLEAKRAKKPETVFYDGTCGFCHGVVRFALAEGGDDRFRFAPLQGEHFRLAVSESARRALPDSFVILADDGRLRLKSDAAIHLLRRLGGLWIIAASLLAIVPRPVRDAGYDFVGSVRHRLFKRPESLCPIVPPALRGLFID
jgi:predicted DCC family thiol-disulfide oxidoreductase YuxK